MSENGKERIGDYELLALIGDGAQGRVYRARCVTDTLPHVRQGEEVALKVVRVAGEDEKLRLKFQEQAEILRRLSHTHIVSYRDCFVWHAGEWDEAQCLVMELLEGEPLSNRLKNAKNGLPWPQVESIFEQCLAGLIHARERGITHRDIKPSNIFITKDGQAKLIDFDIARRDDSGQMSTAGWKGTFDYMAPDFITINGFRGDEVSDIFSLGVCFYQALTGALPYEPLGETAHIGYLNRWRHASVPSPSFRPGVFRVLSSAKAVIAKCLTVRREERYPSFTALLEDFRKIRYRRLRHKNKEEYELQAVLGRGGFGEVFKARRVSDGLPVAVKYLFAEKQSERFLREAKILHQYPHPNLVKYVDFMVLKGTGGEKQYFLVMEFLEGMPGWTLRHRIKNEGGLDVAEVVPLFSNYLGALQFLHNSARPIIHRDIKPGNLYAPMGQPDKAKIFDLGVARDVSGTVTVGGVPGTLDYMAPEFAEAGGDRGSPQSDLYALGLCLYEALTGKPVFDRLPTDLNSAWVAFQDRIRKPPQIAFDAEVFARYPRLKQVITRALSEKPAQRHADAVEMRAALEDALRPESVLPEHDDLFDAGEMTVATLAGARPLVGSGITQDTRSAEQVEATLAVPGGGLIEAGRREAERRRARKRLVLTGVVASAAVGIGGVLLGIRVAERRGAGVSPEPERVSQAQVSTQVPSRPDPEPKAADVASVVTQPKSEPRAADVAPVVTQPKPEPKAADVAPVVTQPKPQQTVVALPPERDPVYQDLLKAIPGALDDDASWLAAEAAAGRLAAQADEPWPGLDEAERTRRLAVLQERLMSLATEGVKRLRDAALAELAAGRDGKADRDRLARLNAQTPRLKASLAPAMEDAVAQVDRAYAAYVEGVKREQERRRKAAEEQAAREKAERQKAEEHAARLARETGLLDTLDVQLRGDGLEACLNGVKVLGAVTPEVLADAPFKARWEASRAAYVNKVTQTLEQKEPLEERLRRLEAVDEVLGHAAAAAVFGAEAAGLRRALEQQKGLGLLRLVNRSKTPLLLTSRELGVSNGTLAGGESKEWLLPVKGEVLTISVAVRGDDRLRSRIETVKLTPGSGVERTLGDGKAGLPTPKAEEQPAVAAEAAPAAPAPVTEPPVTAAKPAPAAAAPAPVEAKPAPAAPVPVTEPPVTAAKPAPAAAAPAPVEAKPAPAAPVPVTEPPVTAAKPAPAAAAPAPVEAKPAPAAPVPVTEPPVTAAKPAPAAAAPAPVAAKPAPAAPAPVTEPPVTAAKPAPAAAAPAPVEAKGAFEITVSPKTAQILLDELPVPAGRYVVSADENHQIVVECKGYKTVQQYYTVKPGETRRIDILLEKEDKRSFFGF